MNIVIIDIDWIVSNATTIQRHSVFDGKVFKQLIQWRGGNLLQQNKPIFIYMLHKIVVIMETKSPSSHESNQSHSQFGFLYIYQLAYMDDMQSHDFDTTFPASYAQNSNSNRMGMKWFIEIGVRTICSC